MKDSMTALRPTAPVGCTVGIFSPSSPATATAPTRYERAKAYLLSKGYKIKEGKLTGKRDYYRSGSIAERAEELNELIRNPDVRIIMSAIGGNNSNSLLPYIDYDALKKDPKIIVGYSDVTAILLGVYAKTGITTFYGPAAVASLGEYPPYVDETYACFADIITGKTDYKYRTPEAWTDEVIKWEEQNRAKKPKPNKLITLHGGKVTGRLVGGNLNTMEGFFGTEYMPEIRQGDILFIEDSLKDPCVIERSFSLLKLAGVFDKVGGVILGKHECYDDLGTGKRPCDVLSEVIGERDYPILADFDCSHTHPMFTLPIGCEYTLDADAQTLTLNK